jgi:hypothetical protein
VRPWAAREEWEVHAIWDGRPNSFHILQHHLFFTQDALVESTRNVTDRTLRQALTIPDLMMVVILRGSGSTG